MTEETKETNQLNREWLISMGMEETKGGWIPSALVGKPGLVPISTALALLIVRESEGSPDVW